MRFVDKVRVYAKAGRGGNGALSFHREKFVEKGGPDGGEGGKGGDIIFRADPHMGTLLDFSHRPHITAADGENGSASNRAGRSAEDLRIKVPVGTLIFKDDRLLADLSKPGAEVLVARGGRGGRGNQSFKTRHNTAPYIYEKGEPGEEVELDLELKLIADVGLVGFPNAGKSTFLSRVSNARPKIADYPFTTLAPHLGIVQHKNNSFVVADIPGLIEGAHAGKGLGKDFLRHVERTRLLIHLIDPMGYGTVSAADGVRKIEEELKLSSRLLAKKPRVLVVNKTDLPEAADALAKIKARWRKRKLFAISAATGEGMPGLLDFLLSELSKLPRDVEIFRPAEGKDSVRVTPGFHVARVGEGKFKVWGAYVERVAAMTDLSLWQSLRRMQETLRKIGVDKALRLAGIQEGDMVRIGEHNLEWNETDSPPPRTMPRRPELKELKRLRGRRPRAERGRR